MKKQILDSPIHESFEDFLKKEEVILWRGKPSLKPPTKQPSEEGIATTYFAVMTGAILMFFGIAFYPILIAIGALLTIVGSYLVYLKNNQKHQINYLISSQQILFELPKKWNSQTAFYSIPISKIQSVEVIIEENYHDVGVVFLKIHHSHLVNFYIRNLRVGSKRYLPTLERIENPEKVANLIRKSISSY